jgi:hypothetical protein
MEKFFLKIDAQSPDGEAVKCETTIKVKCSEFLAASVIANIIKQDENLKSIFTKALVLAMSGEEISQKISDDAFQKASNNEGSSDPTF